MINLAQARFLGATILVALVSGCASDGGSSVHLAIESVERTTWEECGVGVVCYTLQVAVTNADKGNDLFLEYWDAVSQEGTIFDAEDVGGPGAIASGAKAAVTIDFALSSDDATEDTELTKLRLYNARNPYSADPEYYVVAQIRIPKASVPG